MKTQTLARFPYIKQRPEKILIICHRNADSDAYCSAYALKFLLKYLYKGAEIQVGTPGGISLSTTKVRQRHRLAVMDRPSFSEVGLVVVVDTGHEELLKDSKNDLYKSNAIKVFVDHHPLTSSIERIADHLVIDSSVSSTSELVYNIFNSKGVNLTPAVSQALLTGIFFDSRHLALANYNTIKVVGALCETGASIKKTKNDLNLRRSRSEIIARLKAGQRARIVELDEYLFAISHVKSYQASASGALVALGADVALVIGENSGAVQGSLRSSQVCYNDTKLHLGKDVTSKLGVELKEAYGGGHPTAASFTTKDSKENTESLILRLISKKLVSKNK